MNIRLIDVTLIIHLIQVSAAPRTFTIHPVILYSLLLWKIISPAQYFREGHQVVPPANVATHMPRMPQGNVHNFGLFQFIKYS